MFDEVFDEVSSDKIGIWHVTAPWRRLCWTQTCSAWLADSTKFGSAARGRRVPSKRCDCTGLTRQIVRDDRTNQGLEAPRHQILLPSLKSMPRTFLASRPALNIPFGSFSEAP